MYDEKENIVNLAELLSKKSEKNGEKTAVATDERRISYTELDEKSSSVAAGLKSLGVSENDKIALFMPNSLEFLYLWFGAMKLGAVCVPLNVSLKGSLLRYQLNDSDAKVVVVSKHVLQNYLEVKDGLENVAVHVSDEIGVDGFLHLSYLIDAGKTFSQPAKVHPSHPATIMYTSGTTGPPKGVVLPHYAYINTALMNSSIAEACDGDVFYSTVPFFHTSGQLQIVLPALMNDLTAAFDPWFHASQFWQNAAKYGATKIFLISSMINILLKQPVGPYDRNHSVKIAMTGGSTRETWLKFEERFGVKVYEGYGMTETSAIAIFNRGGEVRLGSVGKPLPYFEMKVFDENDNELPPGKVGELVIRPRKPFVMMMEYYKKPSETVRAWRNLWFHTGDLFYRDEDGYFYVVGRIKESIRRRGENISPYEIESVVNEHPAVLESAAVGVPSALGDEDVKVYLKLKPGARIDFVDFLKWCDKNLPYHMVPRYVETLDELPKTPTQRIQRYLLKERGVGQAFDAVKAGFKPTKPVI
ncbi:MAG: AMP-binding protein [Candidatus Caldarchaeum sp.]|nr:AMP-binding protein [Candidatus Caldarchaeum sp.]